MPTTGTRRRTIVLTAATVGAALLTAPAASAAGSSTGSAAACSSTLANTVSPAVGATRTYPVSTVGTVTLKRTALRSLRVVATAPAAGYTTRVKIASGTHIQVSFRQTGSTRKVYFGASPGKAMPDRLHTTVTTCQ